MKRKNIELNFIKNIYNNITHVYYISEYTDEITIGAFTINFGPGIRVCSKSNYIKNEFVTENYLGLEIFKYDLSMRINKRKLETLSDEAFNAVMYNIFILIFNHPNLFEIDDSLIDKTDSNYQKALMSISI